MSGPPQAGILRTHIQGDSRGKYFEKWKNRSLWEKNSHERVFKFRLPRYNCFNLASNTLPFLFSGGYGKMYKKKKKFDTLDESLARSRVGCSCPHKETWRSAQRNNTRSFYTICNVHWGWCWDCWVFVNCNKFVIKYSKVKVKGKVPPQKRPWRPRGGVDI